jgi:2-polyprenyl-3-methyl-5-hydroxy-6-metoxy-1,4-benzoquinol methylase
MSKRLALIEYLDFMSAEYFYVCEDRSVLEIGPYVGLHTKLIAKQQPNYLELVEANAELLPDLKKINGVNNIINDDVMFYVQQQKHYDVVVCCGILYHLHCPLNLLELIANHNTPEWVVLDCKLDIPQLSFIVEPDNVTKNRITRSGWLSTKFSIVAPFEIINLAMENMGYLLIKTDTVQVWDYKPKQDTWVGLWRKNGRNA